MATNKSTWNGTALDTLAKSRHKNSLKFMRFLFWEVLEHESVEALKKARKSIRHYPQIQKDLKRFQRAKDDLVKTLILATKNSDKY